MASVLPWALIEIPLLTNKCRSPRSIVPIVVPDCCGGPGVCGAISILVQGCAAVLAHIYRMPSSSSSPSRAARGHFGRNAQRARLMFLVPGITGACLRACGRCACSRAAVPFQTDE